MILDKQHAMSEAQAVTASAASTNIIDLTKAGDAQEELYLYIHVDGEAATAVGSATVTFALQTDDNSGFSSATTMWSSAAIGKATLVDKYVVFKGRIPQGCERYLRVYFTVATGPLTAGKFSAYLVKDVQTNNM